MKPNTENLITFPSREILEARKIERLDALKARYLELQELQDDIVAECFDLTGESESNGHTWDFLANSLDLTAAELLENMRRNPSDLWRGLKGFDEDPILDDDMIF